MSVTLGRLIRDLREFKELSSEIVVGSDPSANSYRRKILYEDAYVKYKIETRSGGNATDVSYRIVDTSSGEWRDMNVGERGRYAQKAELLFQKMVSVFPKIDVTQPLLVNDYIVRTMADFPDVPLSDVARLPIPHFGKLPSDAACIAARFSMTTDSSGKTSSQGIVQSKEMDGSVKTRPMSPEELNACVKSVLTHPWAQG